MKKDAIAILIISLLISLGVGGFIIKPMAAEVDALKSRKELSDQTALNLMSIKESLENQRNIQKSADILKIEETLPADPGIPDLLIQVQAIAAESGVAIKNLSFNISEDSTSLLSASDAALSGKKTGGEFPKIGINLDISGVYSSIKAFLKNVENNVRIMNAESLQISGVKSGDSLEMSASLKISAYYNPSLGIVTNINSNLLK